MNKSTKPPDVDLFMVVQDKGDDEILDQWEATKHAHSSRPAKFSEITLEAMAEMMDHDAENGNQHAFVGVHAALAILLLLRVNSTTTTRIMRDIVNAGGLHGMG